MNKANDIELDINKRWEEGTDHHPCSENIVRTLADLDFFLGNDYLGIKVGGNGDNGEHMMYLLDIYFEAKDRNIDFRTILEQAKEQFKSTHPKLKM